SLVSHLGTPDFVRVRIGIGRPPAGFRGDVADYVLSAFSAGERALLPQAIEKAVSALRRVLAVGVDRAMNETNTRPAPGGGAGGTKNFGPTGPSGATASTYEGSSLLAPGHTSPGP